MDPVVPPIVLGCLAASGLAGYFVGNANASEREAELANKYAGSVAREEAAHQESAQKDIEIDLLRKNLARETERSDQLYQACIASVERERILQQEVEQLTTQVANLVSDLFQLRAEHQALLETRTLKQRIFGGARRAARAVFLLPAA